MALGFAQITILAHVGQDPEFRNTNSGEVCSFSAAVNRRRGEEEMTDWYRCVTFSEGLIKVIDRFVKKGSKVLITGEPGQQKWEDRNGVERTTVEILVSRLVLDDPPPADRGGAGDRDARAGDRRGDDRGGANRSQRDDRGAGRGGATRPTGWNQAGDRRGGDDRRTGGRDGGASRDSGASRGRGGGRYEQQPADRDLDDEVPF